MPIWKKSTAGRNAPLISGRAEPAAANRHPLLGPHGTRRADARRDAGPGLRFVPRHRLAAAAFSPSGSGRPLRIRLPDPAQGGRQATLRTPGPRYTAPGTRKVTLTRRTMAFGWTLIPPTTGRRMRITFALATGRDFVDVSPLRGVIRGGSRHLLKVEVTVEAVPATSGPEEEAD